MPPSDESQSERREPGIPASRERGPSGPARGRERERNIVVLPLAGDALAAAVMAAWDEGKTVLPLNPSMPAAEMERLLTALRPELPAAADTAAIVATSGTTGTPKGVELTRAGMEMMGRGYSAGLDATADDRWLACLPLHHVASLAVLARAYVTGVPWTVHDGFDLARVASSPRTEGTTIVSLVPTALRRLLDANAPLHEFRRVIVGGAPCPPALRTRAEEQGVCIVDAYGLSETWGGFALDGIPIAGAEVRLDPSTSEICARGAMVMRGYRFDATRTREVIDDEGWLHTGDIGAIDGERLRVVDRLKDLVITGGVNVSPTEVEAVLVQHPDVADVCVLGAADDEWGERVVAYVVVREHAPTLDDIRAFARDHLSAAKLPKELRIIDAIPRSTSGKPLRRVLRDSA